MNNFKLWVQKTFCPTAIVYSSDKAKTLLYKFNLTPSEFLRPFGDFTGQSEFKIEFNNENIVTLKNFKIDFYDSITYKKETNENQKSLLLQSLQSKTNVPDWNLENNHITKNKHNQILNYIQENSFNWYLEYEKTFLETCRFNETEMYQQPLVYVYVCSINDDSGILDEIELKQNPSLIVEGIYECRTTLLLILINDCDDMKKKESQIEMFKKRYYEMKILCFDIIEDAQANNNNSNDLWGKYIHKTDLYKDEYKMKGHKGKNIKIAQIKNQFQLFYDIFNTYIFPKLVSIIEETKKRLKDQRDFFLKKMFKKPSMQKIETYNIYKLSPREKGLYLISIIYFYLGNYPEATYNIKKLRNEMKGKSFRHENNLLQLYTLCKFLNGVDIHKIKLTSPYDTYLKSNRDLVGMLRALIIENKIRESLNFEEKDIQRVNSLIRNFKGSNITSALIIERNSLKYLLSFPIPQIRKFMLYTAISAASYSNAKKLTLKYALNSYGFLYKLLDNRTNSYIRTKIFYYNQMGDICDKLNYRDGCILFCEKSFIFNKFIKIQGERDAMMAQKFKQFTQLISSDKKIITYTNNLTIPEIDYDSSIVIETQDFQIANFFKSSQRNEVSSNYLVFKKYTLKKVKKVWGRLYNEEYLILKNLIQNIITRKGNLTMKNKKKEYICNTNDEIYLRFKVKNPFNHELAIFGITLIIKNNKIDDKSENSDNSENNSIYCQQKDILLKPKENSEICLKFSAKHTGSFEIKGIELKLIENLKIRYIFKSEVNDFQLYNSTKRKRTIKKKQIRDGFLINIIDKDKDIQITFPEGNNVKIYKYIMYYYPITIKNTYHTKIKRVCIFCHDFNYKTNEEIYNSNFICNCIYNDLEFGKEQIFYLPILPYEEGNFYAIVVLKFEEEFKKKTNFQIKRYIFQFKVLPTLKFTFIHEVDYFNQFTQTNSNDVKMTVEVINKDLSNFKFLDDISYDNRLYIINPKTNWNMFIRGKNENYYREYKMKIHLSLIKKIEKSKKYYNFKWTNTSNDTKLDEIIHKKLNEKLINESNSHICFPFNCNMQNKTLMGFYFYLPSFNLPLFNERYIISFLLKSISFTFSQFPLGKSKCVIIEGQFNNQSDFSDIVENLQLIINPNQKEKNVSVKSKKEENNESKEKAIQKEENVLNKEDEMHSIKTCPIEEIRWHGHKKIKFDLNNLKKFNLFFITERKGLIQINSIHFYTKFKSVECVVEFVFPLSVKID